MPSADVPHLSDAGNGVASLAVPIPAEVDLNALIEQGFDAGFTRVEAIVAEDDRATVRQLGRAALRKEGVLRGVDGNRVVFARLATDAKLGSREAFIATLNKGLPTKRVISQALIQDDRGRILLCELVYKQFWDLPGGVVDPGESPAEAVIREIKEELGIDAAVTDLVATTWLPPWRGWDDAVLFLFAATVQGIDRVRLQPREIQDIHWVRVDELDGTVADYTQRLIVQAIEATGGDKGERKGAAYLENGMPPTWS